MNRMLLLGATMLTAGTALADWGTDNQSPIAVFPSDTRSYATEIKAAADGSIWSMIYHPNLREADDEYDTDNVVYEYRLQHFDANGNPTFPAEGIMLCDYANWSYTVVNDNLMVDRDGNAIVVAHDCRNSSSKGKSYTAYKVNAKGEMLWGEDGVAVSDPLKPADFSAFMSMVELEDGSFVFAWQEMESGSGASHIYLQRLSKDGKALWDSDKLAMTDEVTGYPYLVNSGDNTCIMVYGRTSSAVLYARKLDFEGESVWGKDTRIYRGGWGSVPLQTILHVTSSGNGGVLVSWSDDRLSENIESAYISYVDADGKLGFAGQSDDADVKLCYDGWRCFNVCSVPAADGSCFYSIWRRTDGDQRFQGVMMQRISLTGDLMWGDEAKELQPLQEASMGYISLQQAGESDACAFFEIYRSYFDQQCYASRFDKDGAYVWADEIIEISENGRKAADLASQPYVDGSYICTWDDGGTSETDKATTYMMTRLNDNGTFGLPDTGVESTVADTEASFGFNGSCLYGPDGAKVCVYTVAGAHVDDYILAGGSAPVNLPAGFYVASVAGQTVKFVVK